MKAVALVAYSGQISQSFPLLEPHKQQNLAGKSAICMHQHLKFTQQQLHNLSGQAFGSPSWCFKGRTPGREQSMLSWHQHQEYLAEWQEPGFLKWLSLWRNGAIFKSWFRTAENNSDQKLRRWAFLKLQTNFSCSFNLCHWIVRKTLWMCPWRHQESCMILDLVDFTWPASLVTHYVYKVVLLGFNTVYIPGNKFSQPQWEFLLEMMWRGSGPALLHLNRTNSVDLSWLQLSFITSGMYR